MSNFTDLDDRIITRAKEEGKSEEEISEKYIEKYIKHIDVLIFCLIVIIKSNRTMDEIIEFIETCGKRWSLCC